MESAASHHDEWRIDGEDDIARPTHEGRKRTILIAASILVARDYAQLKGKPSPALDAAIADFLSMAEKVMRQIDARWRKPNQPPSQSMTSMTDDPWKGGIKPQPGRAAK